VKKGTFDEPPKGSQTAEAGLPAEVKRRAETQADERREESAVVAAGA
jgi:hypothetical protein